MRPSSARSPVHPHACGENCRRPTSTLASDGSPPRVWGKRAYRPWTKGNNAVHPHACGENGGRNPAGAAPPVHPHACGENLVRQPLQLGVGGSPPRVWGKRGEPYDGDREIRFTPTRVGKTAWASACWPGCPVHPHACGENSSVYNAATGVRGSPPRVWGKRSPNLHKTFTKPVHPHACGENSRHHQTGTESYGSPPRVWGKRLAAWSRVVGARFTPTRVGKTQ